jgi:predicted nucleic acid-binding Zn finger protein
MSDLWEQLRESRALTGELREAVAGSFGDRGRKALRAIDEGRVVRYRDFFVVEGSAGDYVVDDDFCTCGDFLYRRRECFHILAVRIAGITGAYRKDDGWYQDVLREEGAGGKG